MVRLILAAIGIGLLTTVGYAVPLPDSRPKKAAPPPNRAEIQSILDETEALPPARIPIQGKVQRLQVEQCPPFSGKVMIKYRATYQNLAELDRQMKAHPARFPLAAAVRKAVRVLETNAHAFPDTLAGKGLPVGPVLKQKLFKDQVLVAHLVEDYREALSELTKAGRQRARDKSPRWQANYDYVLSRLLARIIYLHEYNLMLGQVRKDNLPPIQGGDTGWRLAAVPKLQCREKGVMQWARLLKQTLVKLGKEHAGTPWALLAKRDLQTPLGLEWQVDR